MSMEIHNTYHNYAGSYTNQTKESDTPKYTNVRDYKNYLMDKFECMKSKDYSVEINSSLLAEATGDEKTAKWLEYNLSLIPETIEKTKSMQEARGCKVLSCTVKINGYDSMTEEVLVTDEADPGTEKARKRLEEKIKKIREEKKAEEKKQEQKRAEEAAEKERQYNIKIEGKNVEDVTRKFVDKVSSSNSQVSTGSSNSTFDVFA